MTPGERIVRKVWMHEGGEMMPRHKQVVSLIDASIRRAVLAERKACCDAASLLHYNTNGIGKIVDVYEELWIAGEKRDAKARDARRKKR